MREELKNCPFCCGEAEYQLENSNYADKFTVVCTNCGIEKRDAYGKEEVIKKWNTRQPVSVKERKLALIKSIQENKGIDYENIIAEKENKIKELQKRCFGCQDILKERDKRIEALEKSYTESCKQRKILEDNEVITYKKIEEKDKHIEELNKKMEVKDE